MTDSRAVMQQALDFCEFLWREVAMNDYANERLEATTSALRAALEAQQEPAQPQGWVPVIERLPEKHVEVLICFAGQNTLASTGQYTGSDKDVKGWCYPWENRAATDSGDDPVVTHWMPLPEVPAARSQPKETT